MSLAKELRELERGDVVEGGTFMEALSDEPVVWKVSQRFDDLGQEMVFDAFWLGVHLGRFRKTSRGMTRVSY